MKSSVLLVDHDSAETAALSAALRAEGFDVDVASTEATALAALARGEHAIALVELMLRGETGLALARRIHEQAPSTKVFLTGLYVLSERQLARASTGASGFVPKPWDIGEVASFLAAKAAASSRPRVPSVAPVSQPAVPAAADSDSDEALAPDEATRAATDSFGHDESSSGITGARLVGDLRRRVSA